jgi:uncharacterized protein YkwD
MTRLSKGLVALSVLLALILTVAQSLTARGAVRPAVRVSYSHELERAVFQFTNEVRKRNNLPPLTWDNSLRDVARAHSADMLVRNYFAHETPEGRSPHERIRAASRFPLSMTGENIWMGKGYQAKDIRSIARAIVDSWMSSPGHRKNLLHPDFTDIGVGVARTDNDIRVTQALARYRQTK